jgi:hypothetical protein
MQAGQTYYQLLSVTENASSREIKTAFRKLALQYHPDKNKNSSESASYFKVLLNAYEILTDKQKRNQYDAYLRSRRGQETQSRSGTTDSGPEPENTLQSIYNQINMLLWDVEDFLRELDPVLLFKEYTGTPLWLYVEKLLTYIDKWIFNPKGFEEPLFSIKSHTKLAFLNYFYHIRVGIDKYFKDLSFDDLVRLLPEYNIMKIDVLLEVCKHTTFYLANLKLLLSGEIVLFPDYPYGESGLV